MKNIWCIVLTTLMLSYNLLAQCTVQVAVKEFSNKQPLCGANIIILSTGAGASTDSSGMAMIKFESCDKCVIRTSFIGFEDKIDTILFTADKTVIINVLLQPSALTTNDVNIYSSRINSRIEDLPTRVEVLGFEEISEENGVKPGNMLSILGDVSGIQIEQSSSVSGAQSLKLLGLPSKYTQILRDGVPSSEGIGSSFSIMQIPPLDLKQVEIIKGPSSTLYGGGAIGGLVNLISRSFSDKPELTFTLNQTSLKETNVNGYYSNTLSGVGISVFGAYNNAGKVDVNGDGFSDLPQVSSYYIHPKVQFGSIGNETLTLGFRIFSETRIGGFMNAVDNIDSSPKEFYERDKSLRLGTDIIYAKSFSSDINLKFNSSINYSKIDVKTNNSFLTGDSYNYFADLSINKVLEKSAIIIGSSFEQSDLINLNSSSSYLSADGKSTFGLYLQGSYKFNEVWSFELGLRSDFTGSKSFILPRAALLYQPSKSFSTRLTVGEGYKTSEYFGNNLSGYELNYLIPSNSDALSEKAFGGTLDFKKEFTNTDWSLTLDLALYYLRVNNPITEIDTAYKSIRYLSVFDYYDTKGLEAYSRLRVDELELYFGYNLTIAQEYIGNKSSKVMYNPQNKLAVVAIYDVEGFFKAGVEASFVDYQVTDSGLNSPSYWMGALMISKQIGTTNLVFNIENLFDSRQTRYDDIVLSSYNYPHFVKLWGPIDGRVFNLSAKFSIF